MRSVTAGSENVSTYVMLVDSASGAPETGYTIANLDLSYVREFAAPSTKADAVALGATTTEHTDNRAIQIDATDMEGLYRVDWPNLAFAAGVSQVTLYVKGVGLAPAVETVMIGAPVDVTAISGDTAAADNAELDYDGTGYAKANSTIGTCTTLTGHTVQTANHTANIALILGDSGELQTDWANGGRLDLLLDSVISKVDVVDGIVDNILLDTAELQTDLTNGGRLDLLIDAILLDTGTTLQAELDGIQTDTEDIQSRIPSALVGGRIDANVGAISADATAADNLEAMLDGTGGVNLNLDRLIIASTSGAAIQVTGNGSGAGASFTGGASAGPGVLATGGSTGGVGLVTQGGATAGKGMTITAGGTSDALVITAATTGDAMTLIGAGTGAGLSAIGGTSDGNGIEAGGDGNDPANIGVGIFGYAGASNVLSSGARFGGNAATPGLICAGGISGAGNAVEFIASGGAATAAGGHGFILTGTSGSDILAAEITAILADTNELQGDWANGGRLDLLIDATLADTNELQGDWANGGRLDLIVDAILVDTGTTLDGKLDTIDNFLDTEVAAILADTGELQTDWANGGRLDLLVDSIISKVDVVDGIVDNVLVDTAVIGAAGAGLTDLGGMSTGMKAEVNTEVDGGIVTYGLDHLVSASVAGSDITDNSIIAKLVSKESTADWDDYVNTTDSLQANKDLIPAAVWAETGDVIAYSKAIEILVAAISGVTAPSGDTVAFKRRNGSTTSLTITYGTTEGERTVSTIA